MLVTSTPNIEGHVISKYFGLVTGEAILGANAVIAVDLDYETISGGSGSMLMVTASGTAVQFGKVKAS